MVPWAPGSGSTITVQSPWVEEMSALLSAEIRDTLKRSSPSKMESCLVLSVMALVVSPCVSNYKHFVRFILL